MRNGAAMKTLLTATALALALCSAQADERVPQQYIGSWCASPTQPANWPEGTVYNRSNKCNSAHEPEEIITLRPDRLLISDMAECKFLEIVSVTRRGTHRLKFWCKSQYETWTYIMLISALGR